MGEFIRFTLFSNINLLSLYYELEGDSHQETINGPQQKRHR